MWELRNPIPESVQDTGRLKKFWQKFWHDDKIVVPYYGDHLSTSHSFLRVLCHLTEKSPSYKACESDILDYAFGKNVDIVRSEIPGFADTVAEQIPRAEKLTFIEWLANLGISLIEVIELSRELESNVLQSGNAYLRIRRVREGDMMHVELKSVHYRRVAYLATDPGEDRIFVIVKEWDDKVWQDVHSKPELVPASVPGKEFNWSEPIDGVQETVIHFMTQGNDDSDWYGRPNIISVMDWMFAEISLGDLSCKVNSTEIVSKTILAFEQEDLNIDEGGDENPQDNFRRMMHTLKNLTTNTNGSRPSSIAGIEYPKDNNPPTAINIGVNRDTKWFTENLAKSSSFIYSVMGWSQELSGAVSVRAGIGANVLLPLFLIKNETTIEPIQCDWENNWSAIFKELAEWSGNTDMADYTVKYADNIASLVESIQSIESTSMPQNPEAV